MRVRISPAYLGLEASQNRSYGATKRIWMTQYALRIPVKEMDDAHLLRTIRKIRWFAKRYRDWFKRAYFWTIARGEETIEEFEMYLVINEEFCYKTIPTWPELIKEGQRRGLLDSRGYTRKGRIT